MKIEYGKVDNVHGRLTVTVEASDYEKEVKDQLKEIGKKHPEPGFRPGHVPAGLLEKKYGEAVRYDAINKVVGTAVYDYIRENKLPVLGNPVADKDNKVDLKDSTFTLAFNVGISPEFDVKLDKDLHVPYYKIEVTDEMVDRQDKALRERFGTQGPGEEVDATALVKGVMTELNEDGTDKEGGIVVENGIVSPQHFTDEAQRELFAGKHVGDSVVFNPAATCNGNETELSSMLNVDKSETSAHHGDFRMDIKEIIVLKPAELGEEYYKLAFGPDTEVKDEESYRKAVREMIEASLEGDSNYRFTIDAKNAIMNEVGTLELPWDILKDFLLENNERLTEENFDAERPAIEKDVEWELEKEQVASKLDLQVTEEDLLNTASILARQQFAQFGMANPPAEAVERFARDIMKDERYRGQLYNQTADTKLFAGVRNAVTLDEKTVSVEEFNNLFTAGN